VVPLSDGDPHQAIAPAGTMALVSGLICVAAAWLAWASSGLLSKPIRYGYMNGIALTVILSQI
jgi:MFS superfamily sulfate permease-like transporter